MNKLQYLQSKLLQLQNIQMSWQARWQEVATFCDPVNEYYTSWDKAKQHYDDTAYHSAIKLASAIYGNLTNPALDWFDLYLKKHANTTANRLWLEDVQEKLKESFNNNASFHGAAQAFYRDIVVYGTGILSFAENKQKRHLDGEIVYRHHPLHNCYISENLKNEVDTLFRKVYISARNFINIFNHVPKSVQAAIDNGDLEQKFTIYHCVFPAIEWGDTNRNSYVEVTFFEAEQLILSEKYIPYFPYCVARWQKSNDGIYGISPAFSAIRDMRLANALAKALLTSVQKAVSPPLLAYDELKAQGIRTTPGSIIYHGLNSDGRAMVSPLNIGDTSAFIPYYEQAKRSIKDAFFEPLLQTLEMVSMTATEVLQRRQEQMLLLSPYIGNLQAEFLSPLIKGSLAILDISNVIKSNGALNFSDIGINYMSNFSQAQKLSNIQNIMQGFELLNSFAGVSENVLNNMNINKAAKEILRSLDISENLINEDI